MMVAMVEGAEEASEYLFKTPLECRLQQLISKEASKLKFEKTLFNSKFELYFLVVIGSVFVIKLW